MTEILKMILHEEGPAGLFKGYRPRIVQSVLTSALLFFAKEKFFRLAVTVLIFLQLRKPKAHIH